MRNTRLYCQTIINLGLSIQIHSYNYWTSLGIFFSPQIRILTQGHQEADCLLDRFFFSIIWNCTLYCHTIMFVQLSIRIESDFIKVFFLLQNKILTHKYPIQIVRYMHLPFTFVSMHAQFHDSHNPNYQQVLISKYINEYPIVIISEKAKSAIVKAKINQN